MSKPTLRTLQWRECTKVPRTDNLGTVRDLASYDETTDTTTVVNHITYDSFGNVVAETAAVDHLFGYTGRAFDEETGLQNNLNRWYDATTGRWVSEDPIGFHAGDTNLYRYVGNRSTLATDPSGLMVGVRKGSSTVLADAAIHLDPTRHSQKQMRDVASRALTSLGSVANRPKIDNSYKGQQSLKHPIIAGQTASIEVDVHISAKVQRWEPGETPLFYGCGGMLTPIPNVWVERTVDVYIDYDSGTILFFLRATEEEKEERRQARAQAGVDAISGFANPIGMVGAVKNAMQCRVPRSSYRAYLNQKFGRTGNLNRDITSGHGYARINQQKQAGHIRGTPQHTNRVKQGKPTTTFHGERSGEMATRIADRKGTPVPGRPNVKEHDFGVSIGTGLGGGAQSRVRVHKSPKTGEIHGHPVGPEKF